MARKKNDEMTNGTPGIETPPEALPVPETVVPPGVSPPGEPGTGEHQPDKPPASTVPAGERREPKGERPVMKFGPYPTSERRTFLTASIWRNEVVVEGGEVVPAYTCAVTRTYYNNGSNEPKNSATIRAGEIQLAILLLEKCDRWIRDQRAS